MTKEFRFTRGSDGSPITNWRPVPQAGFTGLMHRAIADNPNCGRIDVQIRESDPPNADQSADDLARGASSGE